tara:strand:+ start:1014 stop:1139 length:126 start_codon:yes stop_codon:yes gene_type:complete
MNKKCACKNKKQTKHKATKPKQAGSKKVTNKLEAGRIIYNF